METKAVLCDLGGIYLQISFDLAIEKWSVLSKQDPEIIKSKFQFDRAFADFEVNKMSSQDYINHLRNILSLMRLNDEEIIKGWNSIFIGIDNQIAEILNILKLKGIRIIGVTNTNPIHEDFWAKKYADEMAIFDNIYSSVAISLRKPDSDFFDFILKKEGFLKNEVIFFDDVWENYLGGKEYGISSHLYTSPSEMKVVLNNFFNISPNKFFV